MTVSTRVRESVESNEPPENQTKSIQIGSSLQNSYANYENSTGKVALNNENTVF